MSTTNPIIDAIMDGHHVATESMVDTKTNRYTEDAICAMDGQKMPCRTMRAARAANRKRPEAAHRLTWQHELFVVGQKGACG